MGFRLRRHDRLRGGAAGGPVRGALGGARLASMGPAGWEVMLSVTLETGVAAGIAAGLANWWLIFRGQHPAVVKAAAKVGTATAPVRKAGVKLAKAAGSVASKAGFAEPGESRALPGHWLDATECDTQPIPVIRDDWEDEHASVAAEAPGEDSRPRHEEPRPPRRDIVDETDDKGGHVIYLDPYAWDRD
nr:hypothetical protein GCM10020093_090170 [Planobispora longispora]